MDGNGDLVKIVFYENLKPCQVLSFNKDLHDYFREMTAEFRHGGFLFNAVHYNNNDKSRILLGVLGNGNVNNFRKPLEEVSKLMHVFTDKYPLNYGGSSRGMVETRPFVLDDILSREDMIGLLLKYDSNFHNVRVKDVRYENVPRNIAALPGCTTNVASYGL